MKNNLQAILGAGGAIGNHLARELLEYTDNIRLVSRKPVQVNPNDELFPANLLNIEKVKEAVKDSTVVYLTAGLPYNYKVWRKNWPEIVKNVINACEETGAKLVFFDNVYMYSKESIPYMTEDAPMAPESKKGLVRAELARLILGRVEKGKLTALIARCADYYGPNSQNSMITQTVIKPLKEGKKANWLASADYKHSFTFVPDAAKGTALLGNTDDAYNQVWHLPTAENPLTGREWITAIAAEMQVEPKFREVPKFMAYLLGLVIPVMKEMPEMMYQYDRDYIFKSTKFETRFDFTPTPYLEGIRKKLAAPENPVKA
ncbi:NAD-dependent epimerase/dehydratase family protein [Salegentibacter sp.]|uniref:NAD-dependent epimerase/dehydratase family protein n=1 Tax=Salegentibacter sp. TaxID=1903072 RepID=UPI00356841EE